MSHLVCVCVFACAHAHVQSIVVCEFGDEGVYAWVYMGSLSFIAPYLYVLDRLSQVEAHLLS